MFLAKSALLKEVGLAVARALKIVSESENLYDRLPQRPREGLSWASRRFHVRVDLGESGTVIFSYSESERKRAVSRYHKEQRGSVSLVEEINPKAADAPVLFVLAHKTQLSINFEKHKGL